MVKSTYRELTPDDPIFHGEAQFFVPAPRPLNSNTQTCENETNQSGEQVSKGDNQETYETLVDDD